MQMKTYNYHVVWVFQKACKLELQVFSYKSFKQNNKNMEDRIFG